MNDWQIGMLALRGEPFEVVVSRIVRNEEPVEEIVIPRRETEGKIRTILARNDWVPIADLPALVNRSQSFIKDVMRRLPVERKREKGRYFVRLVN
jgi:hypothetical protein